MNRRFSEYFPATREERVGTALAILAVAGAIECARGQWIGALWMFGAAAAIAAAYWLLAMRPARIPRGAVLELELA
ncbi:MAG: hypothetical protein ACREQI_13970, partial [Candidatus Binataceae bacterium]